MELTDKCKIYTGNCLEVLKTLPDESVDCVITSPPYWGLRDYGEETNVIWNGDSNCEHEWEVNNPELDKTGRYSGDWDRPSRREYAKAGNVKKCPVCGKEFKAKIGQKFCSTKCLNTLPNELRTSLPEQSSFCKRCGGWRGQLGLEPTLDLYIEHMLQITVELKRVLKKSGVFFLIGEIAMEVILLVGEM